MPSPKKEAVVHRITRKKIDPAKIIASVGDDAAGAVVLFLGRIRDHSKSGKVVEMAYEAYEPMAEKKLLEVEEEVKRRWPSTKGVKIVHRVGGSLSIGDVSVAVAVSSPHRAEAFEACRHAMERIKHEVPIWKKEKLADGRELWVEGRQMSAADGEGPRRKVKRASAGVRPSP